jgi:hypothetical protein
MASLAFSDTLYCGTFDQGLWRSSDGGGTFEPVDEGIAHRQLMSITVGDDERNDGLGGPQARRPV